jgi:PPOX class probable FMN-dependent enzyme
VSSDVFDGLSRAAVTDHERLRSLYGEPHETVVKKVSQVINDDTAAYIRATSLIFLASHSPDGRCDVTPRGGEPGFVKILGERVLAIPDAPGNRRLDTMHNVLDTGRLGALFVVPGRTDAVRLNGRACVSTDPELLRRFDIGKKPTVVSLVLEVDEVFIHCSSALVRGHAWQPDRWLPADAAPTMNELWASHLADNGVAT